MECFKRCVSMNGSVSACAQKCTGISSVSSHAMAAEAYMKALMSSGDCDACYTGGAPSNSPFCKACQATCEACGAYNAQHPNLPPRDCGLCE